MNTPTILFLNGRYLTTLAELQEMLRTTDTRLHLEILAAYKDGTLTSWLAEGGNDCTQALRRLKRQDIEKSGDNDMLQQIVTAICGDSNSGIATKPTIKYTINEHFKLEKISWSSNNSNPIEIKNEDTIQIQKNYKILLKYQFKIIQPASDSVQFDLIVPNSDIKHTEKLSLREKANSTKEISFIIDTAKLQSSTSYTLELQYGNTTICRLTLFLEYIHALLHFGPFHIKLMLIDGNSIMPNFYIADTPLTDGNNRPITGFSYNSIYNLLSEWQKTYGIAFTLPSRYKYIAAENIINRQNNFWEMTNDKVSNTNSAYIINAANTKTIPIDQGQRDVCFRVSCTEEAINKLRTTHPEYFK